MNEQVIDAEALTFATGEQTRFSIFVNGRTHQQFPMATHKGYQYTTYFNDARQLCVARRALPYGEWEVINFTDHAFETNDSHNSTVIGICTNDGTIHLAFDHHVDNLNYRVSVPGLANDPEAFTWDASLFGPITDKLGPVGIVSQVTYPRFTQTPDGNLLFYYRFVTSGNGDSMVRFYDGNTSSWQPTHGRFIARDIGSYTRNGETSNFRYAYINGMTYGGNRLHVSWVWRDRFDRTDVANQHDLCYVYSDDHGLTWNNSAGEQVAITGQTFIGLDTPGIIVHPIEINRGATNQNGQYAYPDGSIHIIQPRHADGTTRRTFHHNWRDANGVWRVENLGFDGSRPEIVGDAEKNLYLIYSSSNRLRIAKGTPAPDQLSWAWQTIYTSSRQVAEPQVDYSRWQAEGILSIYLQDRPATILSYGTGTPINGNPSPIRSYDFSLSSAATMPAPTNGENDVSRTTSLAWSPGIDSILQRVYLGTSENAVANATVSSPEYMGQFSASGYTPAATLLDNTTYYWRIDSPELGGVVVKGDVWSFTTGTNQPPTISPIADLTGPSNTATDAIPIVVGDDLVSSESLILRATSLDSAIVAPSGIALGGSGANRTLTLTPVANAFGTTTIAVVVDDGSRTTATTFVYTVEPQFPIITLTALNQNIVWNDPLAWSNGQSAAAGFDYVVPNGGRLRSLDGDSVFPGLSLTIEPGAFVQVRSLASSNTVTIIDDLRLVGGSTFTGPDFAEIFAGTGNNDTNVLDGNIQISGTVQFRGFAGSTGDNPRNLRVRSAISGNGTIRTNASTNSLHTTFIDNPANTVSGVWRASVGTLEFASGEAVGAASITVDDHGELVIDGDWSQRDGFLSIEESPNVVVHLGPHTWTVGTLLIGDRLVPEASYTVEQLNAIATDATFTGTGTIVVRPYTPVERWRMLHYGTADNTGEAADGFDYNGDGENNLFEFATDQDPRAATVTTLSISENATKARLLYRRSKAALAQGFTFQVEWSDALTPESWKTDGVIETIVSEDTQIEEILATVAIPSDGSTFMRLTVTP